MPCLAANKAAVVAELFERCPVPGIGVAQSDIEPEVAVAPVGQAVPGVRNHVSRRHVKVK